MIIIITCYELITFETSRLSSPKQNPTTNSITNPNKHKSGLASLKLNQNLRDILSIHLIKAEAFR